MNLFRIYFSLIFSLSILFCCLSFEMYAHPQENTISKSLKKSFHNNNAYEVSEVRFVGNKRFLPAELIGYIGSTPSKTSIPNKILSTYHHNSNINPNIPRIIVKELGHALKTFSNEVNYFNKEIANSDIENLTNLYNTNGFHFTKIYYTFLLDSITKKNVLTFYITENIEHKLASKINYIGLDELPNEIKQNIEKIRKNGAGDAFSEERIESEIKNIHKLLLETGYMHARWDYPNIIMDTVNRTDSIVAYFDIGNRYKIGDILFVDSTFDQKVVVNSTKKQMLRFTKGDYYNRYNIEQSVDNLLAMGTFETVTIDTVSREYKDDDEFVRDFVIKSKYREFRDWDVGLFLNNTQVDNLLNTGFECTFLHRNLFGAAQLTKAFANFAFKDVSHFIANIKSPNYELKIGANYSQPLLWYLADTRVALSTSIVYSLEILSGLFKISKISFPISFPAKLPQHVYFSNFNLEFNIEREVPLNYEKIVGSALDSAKTKLDSTNILSALELYGNINDYLNEPTKHFFTSNLISLSVLGDSRNHPFSPTQGSLTYIGIDGQNVFLAHPAISGGAKYFRFQFTHNHFWKLSPLSVIGIKGKIGITYRANDVNVFVPQNRHFFCGGANSVRAWPARGLRYSSEVYDPNQKSAIYDFVRNYIGSKTLIEGTIEYRRKLADLPGISDNIKWIFNDLGVGVFVDFGNAFDWYYQEFDKNFKINFSDYFTKLAVGTGIGVRYETPVGPIRIDLATPVYDPLKIYKPFSNLVVVFGIGHAF